MDVKSIQTKKNMKKLSEMADRELVVDEIFSHLDDIITRSERMTSGNFMHQKNANRLSANIIKDRLKNLLSEPSIPSNLEDAALGYAAKTECAVVAYRGFKAGAEWMLNQLK